MKNKKKKYIGIIVILAVILSSVIGFKVINKENVEVDPEILVSRNYDEVIAGDEAIDGTEYVTFDAYYLRDLDGDGYADKIRGTCRQIGKEDTLYLDLNVLTNGTLKDAKITINGKNFYFATALVKDSVISKDYVSDNTKEIVLNDVVNGTQKLIFGMTRSGIYESSYTQADAIGKNTNNYNIADNSVVLTGTHVADDGTETPITKTVYFATDWHGTTHTILDSEYTYQEYDINNTIDSANGTLNLNFYVRNRELNNQLILYKNHVEGILPLLNGYAPIKLICTNSDTELMYNEETRKFSANMIANLNENGTVAKTLAREMVFRFVAVYPIEAYDAVQENAVSLDIPIKSWYEGHNNKNISFANPYKSNIAEDIISVLYREPQGENARVDVYIGERIHDEYLNTIRHIISKRLPLNIYNNLSDETLNEPDNYWVEWYISTGTEAKDAPIIMKETDMSGDKFLDVDGNYIDTTGYIKTTGIYFSNPVWLLGEDGYINVYNEETGDLIHTFTKDDWGLYSSENPYMYSEPMNHVRVETSNVLKSSSLTVYHLKNIDDLKLTADYTVEEFEKLNKIHTYLTGSMIIDGEEFPLDEDINFADYEAPYSFATISLDRTYMSNQETLKNAKITIATDNEMFNSKDWQNGVFLIELPEEIIDVNVNRVESSNSSVKIIGVNNYRTETNSYIKIYTSNDSEASYELTLDVDLTADPDKATTTKDLKLYSYNPAADNYHESKRTADIYDLNNNGKTDDYTAYSKYSLSIIAPSNLSTSQYASNYDNNNSVALAPQEAVVDKLDNSRTADINVILTNNYSGTISEIRIVGKIPYEGNTYVLNQNDMNSEFSTTMVDTGIVVPEDLKQYATIYYSENDDVDAELDNELNEWTTTPEDMSKVKSFLIDLGDYVMPISEKKVFTYQVNIPAGIDYNEISYSNHAVFYNLDTDQGRLRTQTEPNKLGIMIAEKYDLQIQKYETSTTIPISQVTFGVKDNETNNSTVASTYNDGIATIENLYVEKEYTFSELIGNNNYAVNKEQVTFIAHIVDGQLQIEILEGNFKNTPVVENRTDTTDSIVKVEFENETKFNFELEKLDLETEVPMESIRFILQGNNKRINLKTDSEGKISISKLEPNVQYILKEVEANGYYLKEDISFMLVREEGELKINILSGNFDTAPVIVRENETDIPTVTTQLKNEIVPKYSLKIVKYENDNPDKKLSGVVFELDGPGKDSVRYTTDENGEILITDLYEYISGKNTDGRYTLTEVYPPDGYIKPSTPINFYAQRDSSGNMQIYVTNYYYYDYLAKYSVLDPTVEVPTVEFEIENNPVFTLKKIDSETGEPIEGAGFTIIDDYGDSVEDSLGNKVGNDVVYPGTLTFTSPENQDYPWQQESSGYWVSTNTGIDNSEGYIISNEFNVDEDDVTLYLDAYVDTSTWSDAMVVELIDSNTEEVIRTAYFDYAYDDMSMDIPKGEGYQIRIWYSKGTRYTGGPPAAYSSYITSFYDGAIVREAYFVKEDVILTDENGEIKLNLDSGFYTMWEVMPKEGYELNTEKYTFGIDKSQVDQYSLSTVFANSDMNLGRQEGLDMISDTEFVACTTAGYISKYSVVDKNVELIWRKNYSNRNFTNVAYANNAIYATDDDSVLMKIDLDGNILWTKSIGVYCSSDKFVEVDDGFIVLTTYNGVKKIDFEGNVETLFNGGSWADSIVVLPDGSIVIGNAYESLIKYNSNYEKEWEISDSAIGGYVSYVDNSLWVSGYNQLRKYDLDGNLIWTKSTSGRYYTLLEYGDFVYGEGYDTSIAIFNKDASLKGSGYLTDYSLDNINRWHSSYYAYSGDMVILPNVGMLVAKAFGGFQIVSDAYENTYGSISSSSTSSLLGEHYLYRSVVQADDGGYLVGTEDGQIIKYNSSGEIEWEKSGAYGTIVNILTIPNDGYILISEYKVTKCDINGDFEWSQATGNAINTGYLDSQGRVVLTTHSTNPGVNVYEIGDSGLTEVDRISQVLPAAASSYTDACLQVIEDPNSGDYILFLRYGYVVRIDKELNVKWATRVSESYDVYCGDIDTEHSIVIASGEEGYIYEIDLETGTLLETNNTSTGHNVIFIDYTEADGGYVISDTDGLFKYNEDFVRQGSGYRGDVINQTIINSNGNYVSVGQRGYIEENKLVFTEAAIAEEVEIVVENTKKRYNITTEVLGGNGTILGEGQAPYEEVIHGEDSLNDIIATPADGYRVLSLTVNGETVPYIANDDGSVELEKFVDMTEDKHVVVQFSNKVSDLIVHHYIKDTTTSVADDEVYYGEVGSEYTTSPKLDLEKYRLVKNEDGSYQMPDNASGIYLEDTTHVVTYYYELKPLQLVVRHLIEGTEERVIPDTTTEGKEGDAYTTSPITDETLLESYILSTDNLPTNATGTLTEPVTVVNYYYTERKHNITTEVDGRGGTISGEGEEPYETVLYKENSTKEIKIEPNVGYSIDTITINGTEIEFTPNTETGGYILPQFEEITEDKHVVVKFKEAKNYKLSMTKVNKITGEVIPNAMFVLSSEHGSATYVTDENGLIVVSSLYIGIEYTLEELIAPDGYILKDEDKVSKFVVAFDENGELKVNVTQGNVLKDIAIKNRYGYYTVTANLVNEPSFILEKQGRTEDKLLANAKFIIKKVNDDGTEEDALDANGNLVGTVETIDGTEYRVVTTNENGNIGINLPAGKYKAIEIATPNGYILPENIADRTYEFVIEESETYLKELRFIETTEITNTNTYYRGIINTVDGGYIEYGSIYQTLTIPAENTVDSQEIVIERTDYNDVGILIKYNSEGLVENVRIINNSTDGSYSSNRITDVSQNSSGETIALGIFYNALTIPADQTVSGEEIQLTTSNYESEFIVKYNEDMKVEWVRTDEFLYSGDYMYYGSIKLYEDSSYIENLIVGSDLEIPAEKTVSGEAINIETSTLIAGVKYNKDGKVEYASETTGSKYFYGGDEYSLTAEDTGTQTLSLVDEITGITLNNCILTKDGSTVGVGYIDGTVTVSGENTADGKEIVLTPKNRYDGIVVKYNLEGKIEWIKQINVVNSGNMQLIKESKDGYVAVGWFLGGMSISAKDTVAKNEILIESEDYTPIMIKYTYDGLVEGAVVLNDITIDALWDDEVDTTNIGDYYYVTDLTTQKTSTYQIMKIRSLGVKEQVKLTVQNTPQLFNITTEVDGEGGTISGQNETPYEQVYFEENSVKDIIVTSEYGYKIESITVNGEPITFTPDSEDNYTLDKFISVKENKHVIVKFEKKDTSVVVKHQTEDGTDLVTPETINGKVGDSYTTSQKDFDNYDVKTVPDNANGTMIEEQIEVIYVYSLVKGKVTVTKMDTETSTKLEGATFKLEKLDDDGNVDTSFTAQENTTNEEGIAEFTDLLVGKYQLTEIKAPAGYELTNTITKFEVTKENRNVEVIAKNREKLVLPATGTFGALIFTITGISLIIIGKSIKKKKENI